MCNQCLLSRSQTIFADNTYSKPYFVTYLNTAFFIIPLIPILIRKIRDEPEEVERFRAQCHEKLRHKYSPVRPLLGESPYQKYARDAQHDEGLAGSRQLLLGDDDAESEGIGRVNARSTASTSSQLSVQETARLSLEFCFLWFAANYFVSACLEYTTVASSTILTSTSSVFTLLFGALFRVERFTVKKLIAVLVSLAGIALISSIDLSGRDNDADHRGDFPEKTSWELAVGDGLAFASAVMYGIYAVFMKSRIGDESRVNMPLFFGLVGFMNVVLLWPGFFILHFTGVETFELPPGGRVTIIIIANSLSSLVSDIAWAYAVLLTSPIVVTVGLSMTIPLSLIGQIVLNDQKASPLYWVGAVAVVLSFVFVSEEEKRDDEEAISPVIDDEERLAEHGGASRS
jgi:solute carrier family 35 protein F5